MSRCSSRCGGEGGERVSGISYQRNNLCSGGQKKKKNTQPVTFASRSDFCRYFHRTISSEQTTKTCHGDIKNKSL